MLAALALVEEHGLDALTMRRVASDLQVTPMSLYNHVADKAELVDLMVDLILGDVVAAPLEEHGDWTEQIRAIARLTHQTWRGHPGLARVYTSGVTIGPNGLTNIERLLRILRTAGFSDQDAADAFFLLYRYMVASLLMGRTVPVRSQDRAKRSDGTSQDRIDKYFSALPSDRIPHTAAVAGRLSGDDFEFGLDVIMTGLRARLAATKQKAAQPAAS
ncbi:MAG: TetR/AcrR family transcriptional regulator [Actinomycetota bacterium]|nr:TetR/AcrR family transcriptional regulator [Actinomycetota bacterium]